MRIRNPLLAFRELRLPGNPGMAGFVERTRGQQDIGGCVPKAFRASALICVAVLVAACGDAPFQSMGQRSSDWIGEPTVTTTTTIAVTIPAVISTQSLKWFNDTIQSSAPIDDVEAVKDGVFERRSGDLFIQASRLEVATLLPEVKFPASAPYLSEYVTSQLVFDNNGELARDPVVAFGIWSSEPYTRSRSVAQMAVLRVAFDPEASEEIQQPDADVSCARFADRSTEVCEAFQIEGRPVWTLTASNGTTLVWFDGSYRYELFGRSFVPLVALQQMAVESLPIAELVPPPA
jgi:hypothetical protein